MGIPYFYQEIIKQNPNLVRDKLTNCSCSRLFLDFNSIIHPISAKVIQANPDTFTYNHIFEEIYQHTMCIIKTINPTLLVYIAFDGVAPYSKIQQQRKRRYMSSWKKQISKQDHPWDSNCISAGTKFMDELSSYLREKRFPNNIQLIISDCNERGEGEHKMIKYLSNIQDDLINIIYGLDADLIILSLLANKNIFLMREKTIKFFEYLDINQLRIDIERVHNVPIKDFAALTIFIGNDFLPSLSFLKIQRNALGFLLDAYHSCRDSEDISLVVFNEKTNTYHINQVFLYKLIERIVKIEDEKMLEIDTLYMSSMLNQKKNRSPQNLNDIENYPIFNMDHFSLFEKANRKINISWKQEYYETLFHKANIKSICTEYIQGIYWIIDYYMNREINIHKINWCYNYNYAPCLVDIFKYLNFITEDTYRKNNESRRDFFEISPLLQLVMILPHESKSLLPQNIQSIYTDINQECLHYFPHDFKFQNYLKTKLWECQPVLPKLNIHHMNECLRNIQSLSSS